MHKTVDRGRPVPISSADRTSLARAVTEILGARQSRRRPAAAGELVQRPGTGWAGLGSADGDLLRPDPLRHCDCWSPPSAMDRSTRASPPGAPVPVPGRHRLVSRRPGSARSPGRPSAADRACRRDAHLPRCHHVGDPVVEGFAPHRRSQRHGRHPRLTFGPPLLLALPAIALVAWSRIRLGDHTPPRLWRCRPRGAGRNDRLHPAALIGSGRLGPLSKRHQEGRGMQ